MLHLKMGDRLVNFAVKNEDGDVWQTLDGSINTEANKQQDGKVQSIHIEIYKLWPESEVDLETPTSDNGVDPADIGPVVIKPENNDNDKGNIIEIKPVDDLGDGFNLPEPIPIEVKIEGQGSEIYYWQRHDSYASDAEIITSVNIKEENSSTNDPCSVSGKGLTCDTSTGQSNQSFEEKPHKCEVCGKGFDYRSTLTTHVKKHSLERPYVCKVCGKTFKYIKDKVKHVRNKHHGVKLYFCTVCGMKFKYWRELISHNNTLNTCNSVVDRPYICNETYQCEGAAEDNVVDKPDKETTEQFKCDLRESTAVDLEVKLEDPDSCGVIDGKKGLTLKDILSGENGCGKGFAHQANLKLQGIKSSHDNANATKKFYICNICEKVYQRKGSLTRHLKTHSEEGHNAEERSVVKPVIMNCDLPTDDSPSVCKKGLTCETCQTIGQFKESDQDKSQKYNVCKKSGVTTLMDNQTGEEPHLCKECGKIFADQIELKTHLLSQHYNAINRPYVCDICQKGYQCSGGLTKHMKIHSIESATIPSLKPITIQVELEGKISKFIYWSKSSTSASTACSSISEQSQGADREKPFKCNVCGKGFAQRGGVTSHMKVHSGERRYSCKECGNRFSHLGNLATHMRTHTGHKPFVCNICDKRFAQQSSLNTHVVLHSGKEKPLKCKLCESAFRKKYDLSIHVRRHTGERPYICDICGLRFKSKHELTRHLKRHSSWRNCVCNLCGKTFNKKQNMTMMTEDSEQSPQTCAVCLKTCTVCSKNFARRNDLKRHMKLHNKE